MAQPSAARARGAAGQPDRIQVADEQDLLHQLPHRDRSLAQDIVTQRHRKARVRVVKRGVRGETVRIAMIDRQREHLAEIARVAHRMPERALDRASALA